MTTYHPDTDATIRQLHHHGFTPAHIATETGVPIEHVHRLTLTPETRQTILNTWHDGIGKLELSARHNLPLPLIQDIIRDGSPHYRRPPNPHHATCDHALSRTDRMIANGHKSPRLNTRQLAERAAKVLTKLKTALEEERRQKILAARVERAARKLADARAAKRGKL